MDYENIEGKSSVGYFSRPMSLEEENEFLKETVNHLRRELEKFKKPPLIVGTVIEIPDKEHAIVQINTGRFYVNVIDELKGKLRVDDKVLLDQRSLTIVNVIGKDKPFDVSGFVVIEKPTITWEDIGGLEEQIREIREVIEYPLLYPEKFKKLGIEPPKGILLYGPPGTGKTLLAKAVAHHSNATFIEIVASELVQKYIGEGSKFVKSIFELAREKAPSIVFIDEVDAIAAKRIELGTSGEREVQRTFMQLLAEIDGFTPLGDVKIIAATNRLDILDPAITRPGRLDRILYIDKPNMEGRYEILKIHTRNMPLAKDVNLRELASLTKGFVGADIKAMVTEAGYFALRNNRSKIKMEDFINALMKIRKKRKEHETEKTYIY